MLTDPGDTVIDPFGGSCMTGEVCQRLNRHWQCIDLSEDYLKGAVGRFEGDISQGMCAGKKVTNGTRGSGENTVQIVEFPYYCIPKPGVLWDSHLTRTSASDSLPIDGGK